MKNISMSELKKHVDHLNNEELILDVRSPDEFHEGHIPGAKNIPHTDVMNHIAELKTFKTIYVHCRAGGRASAAVTSLARAGLSNLVCIGAGGMPDWEMAGFPVEK